MSGDRPPRVGWRLQCRGEETILVVETDMLAQQTACLLQTFRGLQAVAEIQPGRQPAIQPPECRARCPPCSTGDDRRPAPWKRGLPGWRRSECCRRSTGAPTLCFRWPALRRSPGDHEAGVHAAVLHQNGGSCDMCLSIISEMRRSDSEPISANAGAGYRRPSPPVRHGSCRRTARHPVRRTPAGYRRRRWLLSPAPRRLADLRQAGAHHLRLAAQGVRILHFSQLRCESETSLRAPSRWR